MERYRETSEYHREQLIWGILSAIGLLVWFGYELHGFSQQKGSLMGLAYVPFLFGLLIWRYAFRYTYILTDTELIIITAGLGIHRTFKVSIEKTESFADRYHKKFFKQTGIKRYVHRYSSGDGRPTRILVFREGEKKMSAVLFKVSERFMDELAVMMPKQYLRFEEGAQKR
jgi:hypothetical protein